MLKYISLAGLCLASLVLFLLVTMLAPEPAQAEQKWGELPNPSSATEVGSLENSSSSSMSGPGDWHTLAARMAERVKVQISYRPDLMGKMVYVQPGNNRAFATTFCNMLTSELVSRGINVALQPNGNNLLLEVNPSIVPAEDQSWRQVVIVISMWYGNQQILHTSTTYCIDEDDIYTYANPNETSFSGPQYPSRSVRLVGP